MSPALLSFLGIAGPLLIGVGLVLLESSGNAGYSIIIVAGAVISLWRATARGIARDSPRHLAVKNRLIAGCVIATVGAVTLSVGIEENPKGTLGSPGSQFLFVGLGILVLAVSFYVLSLVLASPEAKL